MTSSLQGEKKGIQPRTASIKVDELGIYHYRIELYLALFCREDT